MNSELFEQLLYEDESTTLDFKKKQYLFAKATEEEKSELLKDILGFANAWRRSEAYILIGVKDVKGGRSNVIGILATDHLDDHSLQQFVNNLTNQPARFHYEAFGFEGKQVGIIRIDEQTRPIYLKKDYGKLAREKVYVRRGSSTDPTKPASLEEIAQMRLGSVQSVAELLVEFANIKQDEALGPCISWDVELCKMPEKETIPILSRPSQPYSFALIR
jgi:schlafen family protein